MGRGPFLCLERKLGICYAIYHSVSVTGSFNTFSSTDLAYGMHCHMVSCGPCFINGEERRYCETRMAEAWETISKQCLNNNI